MNALLFFSLLVSFLCSCNSEKPDAKQYTGFKVDTLVTGLSVPWAMAFLPSGEILFTERGGELKKLSGKKLSSISGTPKVFASGQGGLLDIVLHPKFTENQWVYLTYSEAAQPGEPGSGSSTVLARAKLNADKLTNFQKLFKALPNYPTAHHYGSRIAFDKAGFLYLSVGERGQWDKAQELTNHAGKVIRLHDDGRVPADNPFRNQQGALPEIFSIGHRNQQGMAQNPETGEIWAHEHGPKGGDELNIIRAGKNYGWPVITFGINYDGSIITKDTAKAGMEQPITYWIPSIAPSGMCFITSDKYPTWKGSVLVGALSHKKIVRCELIGNHVKSQEILLEGIGRIRDVRQAPDGLVYVAVEGPGMIVRLLPK